MNKDNIITILVSVIASVVISVALATNVTGKNAGAASAANVDQAVEAYLKKNPMIVREALELAAQQEQIEAQNVLPKLIKQTLKN